MTDFFSFFLNHPIFEGFVLWIKLLWFLWLPLLLGYVFWCLWVAQIRTIFLKNLRWILLEIKLPREIHKSPRAMEVVFNALRQTRDGNLLEKYWQGFLRTWFSLEIAGINGEIHFFIYTQKFFRNLVEAQFYAQYPDIEIVEVKDYTHAANFEDLNEWGMWGIEYGLTKEDAYPIKTYIDYGLHELSTKEEQKTDPITSFLEFLGSLKEGEQIWFQVLIRGTKSKWKEQGAELVEKLMKRDKKEKGVKDGERFDVGALMLSPGERTVVEAVERSISKDGFDVGIRGIYIAKSDAFNFVNIASLLGSLKQYNTLNLNGFKPARTTAIDYFFKKTRSARLKKLMLDAYRKRSYFYSPHARRPFVLNAEELATIYHFPGRVAETPTFERIESKKGEPPPTLPV
jgi:hypothetical protein